MKKIKADWDNVKFSPTSLAKIMSKPRNCRKLTKKELDQFSKIVQKEEITDKEQEIITGIMLKRERYANPPLSETAKKYLISRYSWLKYNVGQFPSGDKNSFVQKGNLMEQDAINLVKSVGRKKYNNVANFSENDYLYGKCDAITDDGKVILDVKVSWGIMNYLSIYSAGVSLNIWMQMQGYLDIYGADYGEVCYVLLNTPEHLVDRETDKIQLKYHTGEINSDQYEESMERLSLLYDYSKIPKTRKIITHKIYRNDAFIQKVYSKIHLCREWLKEFDVIHTKNKKVVILDNLYESEQEENNIEYNSDQSYSGHEGG